jgi:AcrR family transcriptional regulator
MDGRRARGDRTRRTVAAEAAALASVDGLSGMTLSQVAAALGVSKGSVQAAYPSKEALQVAAVEAATGIFVGAVIEPALAADEGLPRLRALVDAWVGYVERRVFPGGCFMVATLSEFDSRPGSVRDALYRARRAWLRVLEQQVTVAQTRRDLPETPSAELVAFEIDALLSSANVSRNLSDDTTHLERARQLIDHRLSEGGTRRRTR